MPTLCGDLLGEARFLRWRWQRVTMPCVATAHGSIPPTARPERGRLPLGAPERCPMAWPHAHDFQDAVLNPESSFQDEDLRTATVVKYPSGLPIPAAGSSASSTRWSARRASAGQSSASLPTSPA